ncbi:hypothetical protein [Sphingomonas sp.]|uniref:hypothetical protein n=1 Tax=Sphingomonas sp. TaxID=28214 RepID=UPI0025D86878|nr:hypothetical protein [Sphingomonas sp.]
MKKDVGRAPATPEYPADPELDEKTYPLPPPSVRRDARPALPKPPPKAERPIEPGPTQPAGVVADESPADVGAVLETGPEKTTEGKIVAATRKAVGRNHSLERAATGGRGKFRLLVTAAAGERACAILDRLVIGVEAKGWSIANAEKGLAIVADGETVGFMIEEQLDRAPHVITAAEIRAKADYDKQCALADRGIGYRPWREPAIPDYDYAPNGELTLKFDHDYDAGGTRRTFSDGKRQRLDDLVPSMIESLERWSLAVKAKREERAQWKRNAEEQERRRRDHERQVRIEGYRITFLQRQIERQREIDGLSRLIERWERAKNRTLGSASCSSSLAPIAIGSMQSSNRRLLRRASAHSSSWTTISTSTIPRSWTKDRLGVDRLSPL